MIKPIGNRVLVRPVQVENTTNSGIVLVEKPNETKSQGTVIALGDQVKDVELGWLVWFGRYAGEPLEEGKDKLRLVDVEDIFAYEPQTETT